MLYKEAEKFRKSEGRLRSKRHGHIVHAGSITRDRAIIWQRPGVKDVLALG
jgi:hypothetical protein